MSDIQIYVAITGNTVTNKTITIPDGWQSITIQNVGNDNATITFTDGSICLLRGNGGVLSVGVNPIGYRSIVITAITTTIDYVVTGVKATNIIIV